MTGAAMITLTDFLRARIAERVADPWRGAELAGTDRVVGQAERDALRAEEQTWEARVLAECEAQLQIVERHASSGADGCYICSEYERETVVCVEQRILALPYADHPDWREEWRP